MRQAEVWSLPPFALTVHDLTAEEAEVLAVHHEARRRAARLAAVEEQTETRRAEQHRSRTSV